MKLISYNINLSNSKKIKTLIQENADVYVIPEIADESKTDLPPGLKMKWNGVHFDKPFMGVKSKGLGIIWREEKGEIPEDYYNKNLSYTIPLIYEDVLILGFWPTKKPDEKNNYTKIAKEIIEYYTPLINKYDKCIITGDFNLYKSTDADITKIDRMLNDLKLSSVYHSETGEAFGSETKHTYYHKPMNDKPFFLDYTYSKKTIQNYKLLDWDKNISDHVCQVIEL